MAMVLCVDKKSQIQPLNRAQPRLPLAPGVPERRTQKYTRRGTHRSSRQLKQAIRHCIKVNNTDAKPFGWAKTANDNLASVARFCLRTVN